MFGLIATTGLRLSEALAHTYGDVNRNEAVPTVHAGKAWSHQAGAGASHYGGATERLRHPATAPPRTSADGHPGSDSR